MPAPTIKRLTRSALTTVLTTTMTATTTTTATATAMTATTTPVPTTTSLLGGHSRNPRNAVRNQHKRSRQDRAQRHRQQRFCELHGTSRKCSIVPTGDIQPVGCFRTWYTAPHP